MQAYVGVYLIGTDEDVYTIHSNCGGVVLYIGIGEGVISIGMNRSWVYRR